MIKLIATDMDGTLLTTDKRLPEGLTHVVHALADKGVSFAIASGRQYAALRRDLQEIADDVIFIAENGALIVKNDRQLFIDPLPASVIAQILSAIKGLSGVYPVVCRAGGALVEATASPDFIRNMTMYYDNASVVPDLPAACASLEDVCKIAFYDEAGSAGHSLPVIKNALGDHLAVILSGENWVDVMKPEVHKGSAMRFLQKTFALRPEECMAFGDYLNDCELLESVGESYAMQNALPELKRIARHIAPGNDEDGVLRVIRERFAL